VAAFAVPKQDADKHWASRPVHAGCILPAGFECGVPNGKVRPVDTVTIVVPGLATLLTVQFYSPARIVMSISTSMRTGNHTPKKPARTHQDLGTGQPVPGLAPATGLRTLLHSSTEQREPTCA
jgi:hypothetical protein